eukprot:Colp12_sorted_trinity150504_noHs@20048
MVTAAIAPSVMASFATAAGLASVGGSMVGGIVVLASAPALLGAASLSKLAHSLENDGVTANVTTIAGVVGAVSGTTAAVLAVSSSGAVAGLSAAGITSGLAFLGGGSLAAGGAGMAGGLLVCASIAAGGVVVVGGAAWGITHMIRQSKLNARYLEQMLAWEKEGYRLHSKWNEPLIGNDRMPDSTLVPASPLAVTH